MDEVATEATAALKDAGLSMPLFFSVPSSGEALLTFATPADPSDPDWTQASQIIINIVETIAGVEGLRSRPLPCMASNMAISAADVSLPTDEHVA